ncbi:hypothetical protein Tco_1046624, partial [Tanacetum coccineum]
DNLQRALKNKRIVDSGCSRHMTDNKAYLVEYQDYNGGPVAFKVSAASLINTARPKLSTARLGWCCSKVFNNGKVGAARHKVSAARQKFVLLVTVTTVACEDQDQANKTAGPEEANHSASTQDNIDAGNSKMEADPAQDYFVLLICSSYTSTVKSSAAKNEGEKPNKDNGLKTSEEPVDQEDQAFLEELERLKRQEQASVDYIANL